ncbi:unnamed protein product [Tetraodon nigroviridis]|uniref:(spotted green pufferfish) hypothetical protein n=1 Tax=Tetraodon nigroviridis TaxID=99883 RepID=Q4RPN6_TETNG|nr:unnamed protein product [Tetraodon nigroviridis]
METKSAFSLHRALAQPVRMCMLDFPVTLLDNLVSSNTPSPLRRRLFLPLSPALRYPECVPIHSRRLRASICDCVCNIHVCVRLPVCVNANF